MSAGGLARLGVRCQDPATGIATLGIYCGAFVPPPVDEGGSGSGKGRLGRADYLDQKTQIHRKLAMKEDEEIMALIESYYIVKKKL